MRPIAIIQARMDSIRLPGKVLKPLCDDVVLGYVITRCLQSKKLGGVILATSECPVEDCLAEFAASRSIPVFRGSKNDVLSRYVKAAEWSGAEVVVRITADCPLVAPEVIDKAVELYEMQSPDYAYIDGYPIGLGAVEVLRVSAIKQVCKEVASGANYYREHVVPYLLENPDRFKLAIEQAEPQCCRPELRVCVDEPLDLEVVCRICEYFYPRKDFSAYEVIEFLDKNSEVAVINKYVKQRTS
jgi:spore coat polysaccharide biosynthesis protein SpsF